MINFSFEDEVEVEFHISKREYGIHLYSFHVNGKEFRSSRSGMMCRTIAWEQTFYKYILANFENFIKNSNKFCYIETFSHIDLMRNI